MSFQQHQQEFTTSGPQPITRELPVDLPPQTSEQLAAGTTRHPFFNQHSENAPDVRVAAFNTEAAAEGSPNLGRDARFSTSIASPHTERSLPTIDVGPGESASTAGAVTSAKVPLDVDPNLQARASVEEIRRQKSMIGKEEHGVSRKLSKIEKRGAKVERTTLHISLQELEEMQTVQETSIKSEAKVYSRHSQALTDARQAEMNLLAARIANEQAQANLRAAREVLDTSRKHVRENTEILREKGEEVDQLRSYKKVNGNEQAAVKGPIRRRLGRILGSG